MKRLLLALTMAFGLVTAANAQFSLGIGIREPGVSIGINISSYPRLVRVPGYPVYYYPDVDANYFFYDGLYWVLIGDDWYASDWYNGPWDLIDPFYVPEFVLRIPVRYYRRPPVYFRGWSVDAPPRWDQRWGRDWSTRRRGWDQWDRRSVPPPAPLPTYQSEYRGDRYPREPVQRNAIRSGKYRYEPRESVTREYWRQEQTPRVPGQRPPAQRPAIQQQPQRGPVQPPQVQRPPVQEQPQRGPPQQPQAQRPAIESRPQGGPAQQPQRGPARQERQQNDDEPRGRGRSNREDKEEQDKERDRDRR